VSAWRVQARVRRGACLLASLPCRFVLLFCCRTRYVRPRQCARYADRRHHLQLYVIVGRLLVCPRVTSTCR